MSDLLLCKKDKLDPRAKKGVLVGFKKGVKSYKIWDPKYKKFIFCRDVTFDEASMLKPTISQQVKIEKTKGISQQVESDFTSPSLKRSVSLEIIPTVTQSSDHAADQDTDDNEDQGQASDVQESIVIERARKNFCKSSWLTTNIIVAYALSIIKEAIPSIYREAAISSKSKM